MQRSAGVSAILGENEEEWRGGRACHISETTDLELEIWSPVHRHPDTQHWRETRSPVPVLPVTFEETTTMQVHDSCNAQKRQNNRERESPASRQISLYIRQMTSLNARRIHMDVCPHACLHCRRSSEKGPSSNSKSTLVNLGISVSLHDL